MHLSLPFLVGHPLIIGMSFVVFFVKLTVSKAPVSLHVILRWPCLRLLRSNIFSPLEIHLFFLTNLFTIFLFRLLP